MRSDKVRALLAYLAMEADHPHRREKLAGLLWPGYPEDSARASLRRALADLRQAIGDEEGNPPYLQVTRQTIQFDCSSHAWVDASAFAALSKNSKPADVNNGTSWEEALALYRGEFMEGFSLPDSPEFEGWLVVTREQFKRQVLETLERLVGSLEERGEYRRGLGYAWRAVELDPLRESAQRGLMRLLALSGQRQAALMQYETCAQALKSELEVEPSAETRELYQRILREDWPSAVSAETGVEIRPAREVGECPYRGLASFREQDAPFFFGREEFTQQLLRVIHQPPVLAVILGPSGSGKSSVAHAGLLPHLRVSGDWLIVQCRPGVRPHYSLAAALLLYLEPQLSETDRLIESQKLADALIQGDASLEQVLGRTLELNGEGHCLLLVDQFEELYTLCSEPAVRERFLDMLLDIKRPGREFQKAPYSLLLTMRADFMGEALAHRPFADALQRGSLMLGPMNRQELRAAIERPAEVQGAAFEEGLVERILDDVGREPGNLPLLEFALTLLWDEISSGWLTHAGYERIGAVRGALASYADRVYDELDIDSRERVQRIFTQLVRPGDGTDDTRRVATHSEIGEQDWSLVQHLADRRLVVTALDEAGNETVEVVHEALIGNWDRLKSWIDEARAFRTWQERLRAALRQWKSSGGDEGALLRGALLAEAEGWLADRAHELN
ncbi:MAG: nSTAND1 domain-containing NTPase, partial [Anaerolineales bacterium]